MKVATFLGVNDEVELRNLSDKILQQYEKDPSLIESLVADIEIDGTSYTGSDHNSSIEVKKLHLLKYLTI
jgi:hypothetical protein